MARYPAALVVGVLALGLAAGARADGDPASDYLLSQKVFLPFDAPISATLSEQLTSLATDAARQGYPVRVALIASPTDLGSVTALWGKPQQYSRFLGSEVAFVYRGRLLIVMPKGIGFSWLRHSTPERRALAGLQVQPGANGLARTAITAVRRLAATRGIRLQAAAEAAPVKKGGLDWLLVGLVIAGVAVVLAAALPIVLLRKRGG